MKDINKFSGKYRFLSNFYPCTIEYDGRTWPSAEHAYQAAKFNDPKMKEQIHGAMDAATAKRAGNSTCRRMQRDWNTRRYVVMREIVWCKFSQNPELAQALLATDTATLVEGNTWGDQYWGVSRGRGENKLGEILMEVRGLLARGAMQLPPAPRATGGAERPPGFGLGPQV